MNNAITANRSDDNGASIVAKRRARRIMAVTLIGGSIVGLARARQGTPAGPSPALVIAIPAPERPPATASDTRPTGTPAPKWGRLEIERIHLAHPAPFPSPTQPATLPRPVLDRWLETSRLSKGAREILLRETSAPKTEPLLAIPADLPSKMPRAR